MILPLIVGVVARAAIGYAIRAGVTIAAKRAAQAAVRRVLQRGMDQAKKRLADEARRRSRCKDCKDLDNLINPCDFMSRGNPLGSGPYRGGSHAGVKGKPNMEANHMPASNAYPPGSISYGRRPAIQMSVADHQKTASWGSSAVAQRYRARQAALIKQGKYMEAYAMDAADISALFPDGRYTEAMAEAGAYAACLEKYGKTKGNGRRRGRR